MVVIQGTVLRPNGEIWLCLEVVVHFRWRKRSQLEGEDAFDIMS